MAIRKRKSSLELRDRVYLASLRQADLALYELWRKLPVEGDFITALNELQRKHIHQEIKRLVEEEQS
jgi:hypothetical protein